MTSPISVPWVRTTLAPQALAWDLSSNASAVIQGFSSPNFAGVIGTDTITIGQGASAPTVITFAGTDITAALVAAKINATWASLATVVGTSIKLAHASRVRVTACTDAVFAKIGIPVMDRDRSLTGANSISAPVAYTAALTDLEMVSTLVTVPAGSNRCRIDLKLSNTWTNSVGVDVGVVWMPTGVTITPTVITDFPLLASTSGTLTADTQDNPFASQKTWAGLVRLIGSNPSGSASRVLELTIPPGTSGFRLLVGTTYRESSTTPPTIPPTVSGYVAFGAS